MSDNPPPPKKVGSLRDRIAAFEKPQASSSGPTPPPPRPKPGNLLGQWKPKQLERVAPPTEDSDTDKGGMSTDDARQSISRVGGLKERMAALQGKGAFGAPADSSAPKAPLLPSEQGKARVWRTVVDLPPPPAATHDEDNNAEDATALPASDDATKEEDIDVNSEPKTEEDLERERRAAIAARMAKLGGARVGMGPPIFGKKPAVPPKPKLPAKDEEKATKDVPATVPLPTETAMAPAIPAPKRIDTLEKASSIPLPTAGDDTEDSVATVEEPNKPSLPSLTIPIPEEGRQRTISGGQRSPSSMPAPAIPRRAAPPRRKQAPPPPPPLEPESEPAPGEPAAVELPDSTIDTPASEATEMEKDTTVGLPSERDEAVPAEEEAILDAATPPPASTSPSPSPATQAEDSSPHDVAAIRVEPPTPHVSAFANVQSTVDKQEEAEAEDEPDREEVDDEDEESPEERRKRISEKLKEMGAVNPLAGRLGEPAQITAVAEESDAKIDVDSDKYEVGGPTHKKEQLQEMVPTDHHNQYAHEHHDEDGSEVDYPGGSVASPTSPTRITPVPPVAMSVPPPPPLRPLVEAEKQYEGRDHYEALGEFAEEEGQVSSAVDVDEGESKDVHVLLASRQWTEDGGEEGEDPNTYSLRAATFTPDDSAIATPATPVLLPPPVPSALRPLLSTAVRSEKKPRPESITRYNRPLPPPPAPPPVEAPPVPPQAQLVEQAVDDDEEDDEPQSLTAALNAALARRPPVPRMSFDAESAAPVSPTSLVPAINRPPPPPPVPARGGSVPQLEPRAVDDSDDEEFNDSDEEPSPLPPPVPARTHSPPPVPVGIMSPIMVNTPPPTMPQRIIVPDTPIEERDGQKAKKGVKKPTLSPPMWEEFMPVKPKEVREKRNGEVMDDEDTDPIDPTFVLLNRSQPPSPQEEENQPPREQEEDPETIRKRTIAERMAKLGGFRFGAPMPPVKAAPPKPVAEETENQKQGTAALSAQTNDSAPPGAEDEDETARRRRIAAKVAAMGGRGLGMGMFGIAPPPAPVHAPREEEEKPMLELSSHPPPSVPTARPPPRPRVPAVNRPPPPPPGPQESESEIEIVEGHEETEDEGEEIRAEDITEDEEPEMVEAPPPPPPRGGRPPVPKGSLPPPPPPPPSAPVRQGSHDFESASPPPLPGGRRTSVPPPVRTTPSTPAPISNTVRLKHQSPPRTPSSPVGAPPPPPPPPPPPSVTNIVAPAVMYNQHSRPTRTVPAPVPPLESPTTAESSKQQQHPWELPNIPSGSFDLGSRPEESMQMSWTEVGGSSSSAQNHTYPPGSSSNYAPFAGPPPTALRPEALALLAQRLNSRIIDSAHSIHEKSKKNVIGDGTSFGFLQQVLSTVPTASTESLGHLIYAQTGTNVTRRAGDIIPGDIIALYDAKMKGHKGLASYTIVVGSADEPLLGIVSEFSASGKKIKVKAFAVNQHPNAYPTIDTPSYRLDYLKSGTVKVFRIAEI